MTDRIDDIRYRHEATQHAIERLLPDSFSAIAAHNDRGALLDEVGALTADLDAARVYDGRLIDVIARESHAVGVSQTMTPHERVKAMRAGLDVAGSILGRVCVLATRRSDESLPLTDLDEHGACAAVRRLLDERDGLHSMHEDETTWRKAAERERDEARAEVERLRNLLRAASAVVSAAKLTMRDWNSHARMTHPLAVAVVDYEACAAAMNADGTAPDGAA